MKQAKEQIRISDHFTYKKLTRFVLPSIIMMAVTSVYGVIDGLFISNFVGKTPFASINLIMPLPMILGGFGFMIGTGGTAIVSKVTGEKEPDKANGYFSAFIVFAVLSGLLLTALGEGIMRPVAKVMGATDEMMKDCILYGRILVGFTVFYMLQNIFQSFLAAAEKPGLGLLVTVIAGFANAVLDALFIVVFKWGVAGAAIATVIGQMLGGIIPLVYFLKKKDCLLKLVKPRFEFKVILKGCGNGSSELLTNVSASIVSMLYNKRLMSFFGENGVSAYGVLMYVQLVFIALEIGFTIGSAPIIAYNYGAKNDAELKNVFKKSVLILSGAGVVLSALAQALAFPLSKLFVGYDKELCDLTVHAFRLFSFSFILSGVAIYSSGFFTALNNGFVSALLSLMRSPVFQISFVFVLPALFGVEGIWWAMFATEVCSAVVAVIFFVAERKKYRYI